jgi:hypothetical protein
LGAGDLGLALNIIKSANSTSICVAIYVMHNNISKVHALSNNITAAITASNTIDLADTVNAPQNAGTNITYSLNQFANQIPASATFALNAGECIRRLLFVIFAPEMRPTSWPPSGRKSTQATVRTRGAGSLLNNVF